MLETEYSSIRLAEASVLGQILLDERLIIRANELNLEPGDFSEITYAGLYKSMVDIFKDGKNIDIQNIKSHYERKNRECSLSDLSELTVICVGDFERNVLYVKKNASKRNLVGRISELYNLSSKMEVDEIAQALTDIATSSLEKSDTAEDMIENAVDIKRVDMQKSIRSGFKCIDDILGGGFRLGTLTILSGEPGSGKSTILNQIVASGIDEGYKSFIYSGELTNFNVLQWLMRTVANVEHLKEYENVAGKYYDVNSEGEFLIREWVRNKLFIFSEKTKPSSKNICLAIEYLARKDVKLFVVDNLMTIEEEGVEEYERQKSISKKLKALAKKYNIAIILVAHPKKRDPKKDLHMFDVAGASEVVNLADYVIMLIRTITDDGEKRDDATYVVVLKNRITGKQRARIRFEFDDMRKRFYWHRQELLREYGYSNIIDKDQIIFEGSEYEEVPF